MTLTALVVTASISTPSEAAAPSKKIHLAGRSITTSANTIRNGKGAPSNAVGVDGDFYMHGGNIPFYIKEGFEGVIPEGTPIMQIIPFLRENWVLKKNKYAWNIASLNTVGVDYKNGSWYRRKKWQKKIYR